MGQGIFKMKQNTQDNNLDRNNNLVISKPTGKRFRDDLDSGTESCDGVMSPAKRTKKKAQFTVHSKEMHAFFRLLEDPVIYEFLCMDICRRISDKYLLAMVFAYFKRANFTLREYNRTHFFLSLYLANDIEEDEEDYKFEIFPWALGHQWRKRYDKFIAKREKLWKRMDYRAVVSRKCCEEVMNLIPEHWAWKRQRPHHHGGAVRQYLRDADDDLYPRGPDCSPRHCDICINLRRQESPGSWYLSSSSDSSPGSDNGKTLCNSVRVMANSRFNLDGLRATLKEEGVTGDETIWAHKEE